MKNRNQNKISLIPLVSQNDSNLVLKGLIWLYFFLLLFEGALRKWVLPGLSTPILIIRDPIAIYIVFYAIYSKKFPLNLFSLSFIIIGFISLCITLIAGHVNLIVALFGARLFLLHLPVLFIIGRVFNREDVLKIGKVCLYLALPMTILIVIQFYTPQSSWVNRGIGDNIEGSGFAGANGFSRPAGIFSFTTGAVSYYSLLACYVAYFWFESKRINKILLVIATCSLLLTVPFSISRSLFFQIIISLMFAFIILAQNSKYLLKGIILSSCIIILFTIVARTNFLSTAIDAFTTRFNGANEDEGGLVHGTIQGRFYDKLIDAFTMATKLPFWGKGLGIGSAVADKYGFYSGVRDFEWERIIEELGFLLGSGFIFLRVYLSFKMLKGAFIRLMKKDILPWMLVSYGFLNIIQIPLTQPNLQGFMVLIGGLILASFKRQNV